MNEAPRTRIDDRLRLRLGQARQSSVPEDVLDWGSGSAN